MERHRQSSRLAVVMKLKLVVAVNKKSPPIQLGIGGLF
nr:MAG TPA: hypothetical protein [Bacteriophage sp.]